MKNYICIDGKKAELTPEQLKALGIEVKEKSPFERVAITKNYWYIAPEGDVILTKDYNIGLDNKQHKVANYCTDKELLEQQALHETLNRLLWRFSMENGGDKIDWQDPHCLPQHYIYFNYRTHDFEVDCDFTTHRLMSYFYTEDIAFKAIEEIVKPFMEEHPEFKW